MSSQMPWLLQLSGQFGRPGGEGKWRFTLARQSLVASKPASQMHLRSA
jgi:hypothetical protein